MADKTLTAPQLAFVNALYGPARGNLKAAAKIATGTEEYIQLLDETLLDAIKKRADNELTLSVPKALYVMTTALDNPEDAFYIDKLHKIAADILDRAGVSKQERPTTSTQMIGIVMLPSKNVLPPPPPPPDAPMIDADVRELFDGRLHPIKA